ncbi:Bug family tripartite tricarboxylate transporter substrate binding protein [Paralcaligenes ureilyticus]|uniref:Tripartite-type tricarboxylate transporter receptor subunit TctC n=1 Tax=Paralcaligenes ureilyticus TaxID=627131 RepID=A0A4R3M7D4_9BURK|nr:tripartite tricarboxylate transporter substrate binding protein [Paralcaligenes ureilyticus]TCT08992.1 tripartite-type tricarboxylate transporter receptor subunit TctC [Paralcaligenes ureilyticus]
MYQFPLMDECLDQKMKYKKFALTLTLTLSTISLALPTMSCAAENTWPDHQVTLVVGYAAGGTTDIIARLMAKTLTAATGQPFVVENRSGANSNIGAENVKRARADGYTYFVGSTANAINHSLYKNLNYNIYSDFESVALLGTVPNLLVVNPKLPVKTVQEYIDFAKQNPGKLSCASSGTGSGIHMSCELFKLKTGTNILHVPFRGSGPADAAVIGNQVDSIFDNLPSILGQVKAGSLRALGITTLQRSPSVPNVPTLDEAGVKGFSVQSWFGLFAPKNTDPQIVQKINALLNQSFKTKEMIASYSSLGIVVPSEKNTPRDFNEFVKGEVDRWATVVKEANLPPL